MLRTVILIGLILAVVGYRSATGQQDEAENGKDRSYQSDLGQLPANCSRKTPAADDSSETEHGPNQVEGCNNEEYGLYLQNRESELSALEVMLKNYLSNVLPAKRTKVRVDVDIERFFSFDAAAMEYSMQLAVTHQWRDPRLDIGKFVNLSSLLLPLTVPDDKMDKIWTPETYCFYEKQGDDKEKESETGFLEIGVDGSMTLQNRMSRKFLCEMDFHKFPFDTQECILPFVNNDYKSPDVEYYGDYSKSTTIGNANFIPEYSLGELTSRNCSEVHGTDIPCVIYAFKLSRRIGYYVIYFYIPTVLLLVLSWLPFWGSVEESSSGIGNGLTIIMSLAVMSLGFNSFLPRVSYVKAMDVWLFVCVVFVFAVIIQNAAVDYRLSKATGNAGGLKMWPFWRRPRKVATPDGKACAVEMLDRPAADGVDLKNADPEALAESWKIQQTKTRAEQMNVASRFCYPLVFLVFAIAYWVYYNVQ